MATYHNDLIGMIRLNYCNLICCRKRHKCKTLCTKVRKEFEFAMKHSFVPRPSGGVARIVKDIDTTKEVRKWH